MEVRIFCDVCHDDARGRRLLGVSDDNRWEWDNSTFGIDLCDAHYASFKEACETWLKEAVG